MLMVLVLFILLAFALRISFVLLIPAAAGETDLDNTKEKSLDTLYDQLTRLVTKSLTGSAHFKVTHVLLTALAWMLLLPFLLVTSLCRDSTLTVVLRLLLSTAALVVTSLSLSLWELPASPCTDRGSCNHKSMSVALVVMTFLFLLTTILRLVFKTRAKKKLVKVRIIGAILEEISSQGSHRIQQLVLALLMSLAVSSGNHLLFQQTFRGRKEEMKDHMVACVLGE